MKKLPAFFKLAVFGLLLALSLSWELSAQSAGETTTKTGMYQLAQQSKQRVDQSLSGNLNQQPRNLNEPNPPLLDLNNPWQSLRELIDSGMQGLQESSEALTQLELQLNTLKAETQEQRRLLEESKSLVLSLKQSLEDAQNSVDIAIDRMQDAENYALYVEAQNIFFKQQAEKYRKSALVGFSFGGVSFGVGVPLMVEGIRSDNRTMLWSGVGIIGVGSLVWVAGHYIFQWW